LLGHRDERDTLGVEDLDQPGKIGERTGEPVDLVDDDIDPAGPDVGEQALQRSRSMLPPENPPSS
jgi:hypothetical protein